MSSNPAFDIFEEICVELRDQDESVLIDDDFSPANLQAIKGWAQEIVGSKAVAKALIYLTKHFEARGSVLPFSYDPNTGRLAVLNRGYAVLNRRYIDFVSNAQEQRSVPKESRDFEIATSKHLASRLTGIVRRVGWPRKKFKSAKKFAAYLIQEFAFRKGVIGGHDRDGGLDILWFPPLGAFPFRSMVSIQCKNSLYDREQGLQSVGRAKQTLRRHSHAGAEENHLHCVVYNDYIDERLMRHSRDAGFIPLGLSDLAPLTTAVSVDQL
jgi:hypothetical protein